jgi:hypothetical protein
MDITIIGTRARLFDNIETMTSITLHEDHVRLFTFNLSCLSMTSFSKIPTISS